MSPLFAVAFREYRIRLTNPILPLWDVLVPVVYLLIFGASVESWLGAGGEAPDYPTFFLGAVLAMVTFSVAMNSSYAFFEDLQSGIFHEILTYPFPRRHLLVGKLVFNGLFSLAGAALCVAAGAVVLGVDIAAAAWPGLLLWTAAGTAGWFFLFSYLALRVRGFNAYHTTTSGLYLLLMFVSNLFYPVDRLPTWVAWLARANPITWQVDWLRHHTYGVGPPSQRLWLEAAAFAAFTATIFWLANRKLNAPVD